jgi:glucose-6-phosphate isomerase
MTHPKQLWTWYKDQLWHDQATGIRLDVSRMHPDGDPLAGMAPDLNRALVAMAALEGGAIANPDEGRRVGHYWLRDPELAPEPGLAAAIRGAVDQVRAFAGRVHDGTLAPTGGGRFTSFLLVGIGGSALGPQFVAHALGRADDRLRPFFIDNTDPDGMDDVLSRLGDELSRTLTVVVSKSGGTKETRNGMVEVAEAYRRRGLRFGPHAAAVTGEGSALDAYARTESFLEVFPMWDWVGGRTSVLSAVGLLPAALQGLDVNGLLDGAREMDRLTRALPPERNPAALLAAAWYRAGRGHGERAMVVLPYKDRLLLFSRYLQQLVMESLGKERDLDGTVVHQGLVVYGNKGSTDQHAYVQQLRDGPDNYFATFIEVARDREGPSMEVEPGATAGDYLLGFLVGTRQALHEKGHGSITLTLPEVSARTVGMLIALYERAVGLYAELIHVNAYDQPGVEAGKKAAGRVLDLQERALAALRGAPGREWDLETLAGTLAAADEIEILFKVLEHAAANPDHGVFRVEGATPWEARYRAD